MTMRACPWLLSAALCLATLAPLGAQPTPNAGANTAGNPAVDPSLVVGAPRGARLQGTALDTRTAQVGGLLRCPVCQGLSVADSPSGMAVDMKHQVRAMLAAGYDEDQILTYFERSYGEFVRLKPPLRGINWLVWIAPLAGLVLGGALVWRMLVPRAPAQAMAATPAAMSAAAVAEPLPDADTLPDDPELARYVLRARALAYGWPDGVRPKAP
jgi:cytochrome c-type biogenesis protein CcmH